MVKKEVSEALRAQTAERTEFVVVTNVATGVQHLCARGALQAPPCGRATACGWRFGQLPKGGVALRDWAAEARASFCGRCWRKASKLSLGVEQSGGEA